MSLGHETVLLLYNPLLYETADIISTYVYRRGLESGEYSYATGGWTSQMRWYRLYLSPQPILSAPRDRNQSLVIGGNDNAYAGTTRRIDIFAVFNCAIMLLIVMVMLYPFYYVAIVSISDSMEVAKGRVHWLPVGLSFAAYEHIFSNEQFVRSFGNTLLYVTTGTLLNLFMSTLCAYPLSRKNFPLNRFFSLLIIFTMYFSGGMIPMYILINNLNMIDTIWAIILPGANQYL